MSTLYYFPQQTPNPQDSHYEITDGRPHMLKIGHQKTAPNSLVWEIPVNGLAIVFFGRRTAILAPVNPPLAVATDDNVFHNFSKHIWAMIHLIVRFFSGYFPAQEPLETFVVCRWDPQIRRDYLAEARQKIQESGVWRSVQWIDIPPWIPGSAGTTRVIVGQNDGIPTLRIAGDTWPININHGYEHFTLTQDPALFTEPVTRLPMADTIIETYENYLQMQHSDQADMNRVVASIASQVSATTTTYPDIGMPSNRPDPDRSQDIGIASTIPEPSAGPSSSQAQPHESASQFEN